MVLKLVDTLNPVINVLKSFFTSQVEWNNDAVSLAVKLVSDVAELFLSGRVPNPDFYSPVILLIVILRLDLVDCNRLEVARYEFSFIHSSQ